MRDFVDFDVETNRVGTEIVDAAFQVHWTLGPGLLENAYEACLVPELETGFRVDLSVQNCVVIELKAVDQILPIHRAQLITYLKLAGCQLGYLINFNTPVIKNGIRRIALTSD